MSITNELRKWGYGFCGSSYEVVNAIADRIDAEHESKVSYWQGASYKDGYDEGFASADDWLGQHEDAMAEHGWIRLPKDADGVSIRVGERVQLIGNDPSTVSHMSLADDGWRVYVKYDGGIGTGSGEPKRIRHHHAPTVENVLHEFICDHEEGVRDEVDLIAEYAAKLRLAEVDDASSKVEVLDSSNCANNEPTSDELNPCPFCGGIPMVDCGYHYDYDGGDRWYVYSADVVCGCGCTLHVDNAWPKEYVNGEHSLDFAIAAWNRRAEHD